MASMPMIVPPQQFQQQTTTSDIFLSQTIEPENSLIGNTTTTSSSSFVVPHAMASDQQLPNSSAANNVTLNDNAIHFSSTMTEMSANSNSCSIELFDASPPPPPSAPQQQQQQLQTPAAASNRDSEQQTATEQERQQEKSNNNMKQLLQQQYNQYYQNYQNHQTLMQNMNAKKKGDNESFNTSKDSTANTSTFNSSILSGDDVSTIAETAEDYRLSSPPTTSASAVNVANNVANVPIAHLMAGKEYPSLQKQPTTAIVQSFTPVYRQTAVQQPQTGNDIYQEYVQNPYNLTLQQTSLATGHLVTVQQHQENLRQLEMQYQQQQQQLQQPTQAQAMQLQQQQQIQQAQQQNLNHTAPAFNSPANFFNSTVDPNSIPPGSEILFGQP